MAWIQLRFSTDSDHGDLLGDLLMEQGALSVSFEDAQDTPIFEPELGETPLWKDTVLIALFEANTDLAPIIQMLKSLPSPGPLLNYRIEQVEDKDWLRAWMDDFHPIKFGRRLWICPSWREIPDPAGVNVILDPGLAFGTGTHPTTALCLKWLDSLELSQSEVIDFGCGSGILAIAALKLGAQKVTGIDIDYQAIDASTENAKRNKVEDQLSLFLAHDQPQGLLADVLVANILAGPLKELAENIAQLVKPGGRLALSGLLREQTHELMTYYSKWFDLEDAVHQEDWSLIHGIRKLH